MSPDKHDYSEFHRLIMYELRTHTRELARMNVRLGEIEKDITRLKVKASLWGGLMGALITGFGALSKIF